MSYKLGFLAGTAAGYVLGARAGRTRYEEIKKQSAKAWGSAPVQNAVAGAAQSVKDKTPQAAHGLVDKAVSAVQPDGAATTTTPSTGMTPGTTTGTTGTTPGDRPTGPSIS